MKIKLIEHTYQVGEQLPVDSKGLFKNLDDMRNPGNNKYSKFYYYYSGMIAYDMSTGDLYVWRERTQENANVTGVLQNDFLYKHKRKGNLYDYEGKYFNFFPISLADALLEQGFIETIPYPEYTIIERDNLTNVIKGTKIWNLDTNRFDIFNGTEWVEYIKRSEIGVPNGVTPLDNNGLIDSIYLPSYVDDVIEVADYISLPNPGETGKIYITTNNNLLYRWDGINYISLNASTIYKTVGTNGDYFTITDAIADRQANLILISDVTEIADLSIDYRLNINLNSHILDMTTFNFQGTAESYYIENGTISYSYSSTKTLFSWHTELYNITVNNNSTSNDTYIVSYVNGVGYTSLYAQKCVFNIPNYANSGLKDHVNLIDCEINGGSTYNQILRPNGTGKIENIIVNAAGIIEFAGENMLYSGIFINNENCEVRILKGHVFNLRTLGKISCDTSITDFIAKDIGYTINGRFINGEFKNSFNDYNNNTIYDKVTFELDVTMGGEYKRLINCTFKGNVILGNNNITMSNCHITSGSVLVQKNNITLDNCRIDNGTININATADDTKIIGCRTATPIVDNGTNTEII